MKKRSLMDTSNNSIFSIQAIRWPLFHKVRSWPKAIFRGALILFALILTILSMINTGKQAEAGDFKKPVPVDNMQLDLASCLVEKGWVLYSSSTCSACRAQMGLFGKTSKILKVVECNPHVPENQVDLCLKKKIRKTPTWILDKDGKEIKRLEGFRSVDEIVSFSGCGL